MPWCLVSFPGSASRGPQATARPYSWKRRKALPIRSSSRILALCLLLLVRCVRVNVHTDTEMCSKSANIFIKENSFVANPELRLWNRTGSDCIRNLIWPLSQDFCDLVQQIELLH